MSALHDELVAPRLSRCITCTFLAGLPAKERAEWEVEMLNVSVSNEAFSRAMEKRGVKLTDGSIRTHRINHARPA